MTLEPCDPLLRVRRTLKARSAAGLGRALRPRPSDEHVIDLAGNDYLGLAHHPRVIGAAAAAAAEWGVGSTGSRLVTGSTALHHDLERALAGFGGSPGALVLSSGYLANIAVLGALGGAEVTMVSDALNHASIVDACRLSRSAIAIVPHRDVAAVESALQRRATQHAVVITEAIYSVDGDLAPLAELHRATRRHGALLVVDEAHSFGVVGPGGSGAVAAAGLAGATDIIRTVTLSKALGAQGGAVLADDRVIELLVNVGRPVIFDTALAPPVAGAALESLAVLNLEPGRPEAACRHATILARELQSLGAQTSRPAGAVLSVITGTPESATRAAAACLQSGVRVACFRPPTVPDGGSCLRLAARADLSTEALDGIASIVADSLQ